MNCGDLENDCIIGFCLSESFIGIGVNVDLGQCASGRVRESGPFQCKDDDTIDAVETLRNDGSLWFSCEQT